VGDAGQVFAGEFQDARLGLHGDHAQAQNVAQIAQRAPAHRPNAAGPAGDEPANGGGAVGGGHHALFLAGMRARFSVQIFDHLARLDDHAAGVNLLHLGHVLHVHDHATGERHGLTVIAGARAACRDRHIMGEAGLQNLDHLGFGARGDDEIADQMVHAGLQHRRVPEEIAALLFQRGRVVVDVEMVERFAHGGDVSGHCLLHKRVENRVVGR
jgi:hypothetical protein